MNDKITDKWSGLSPEVKPYAAVCGPRLHAAHSPGWSVGSGLAVGKKACSAFLQHVTLWEFPGQFQFLVKIIGPMCKMLFER